MGVWLSIDILRGSTGGWSDVKINIHSSVSQTITVYTVFNTSLLKFRHKVILLRNYDICDLSAQNHS